MRASKQLLLLLLISLVFIQCKDNNANTDLPSLSETLLSEEQILNPSGYAPLTAQLNLETEIPTKIDILILGKKENGNLAQSFTEITTIHEIPILGLYADYANVVRVTFFTEDEVQLGSKEYMIQTEALSPDMPQVEINVANPSQMAKGWTFVSYLASGINGESQPNKPFMFDTNGDIRWYLDFTSHPTLNNLFYDNGMERLFNGNLYFGNGSENKIYEINMLGEVLNTWTFPGYGNHHQVLEKPNGNFIFTANKLGEATIEDYVVEIDRQTSAIVNVWNLNQSLQYSRRVLTGNDVDWFHGNALDYDQNDNTIVVSGRTQALVKLTSDNEVVWILGNHTDWGIAGNGENLNQFLLQPLDSNYDPITDNSIKNGTTNHSDFEWNWYQHAPQIMPNGNIMLFDNGDNRNFTGAGPYSRAVEFEINEADMTVKQVWQYGKERGTETYSRIVSDIDYYPDVNHVFFSPGAVITNGRYGKVVEIDYSTKKVLFEATITAGKPWFNIITFHRTERMNIYPSSGPIISE